MPLAVELTEEKAYRTYQPHILVRPIMSGALVSAIYFCTLTIHPLFTMFSWAHLGVWYASFMEWLIHAKLMHSPRSIAPRARKEHAELHHPTRRTGKRFAAQGILAGEPEYMNELHPYEPGKTSGMWRVFLLHLPLFGLICWLAGWNAGGSFALTSSTYLLLYEVTHWHMHLARERPYRYRAADWYMAEITKLHRIHHGSSTNKDFNVVLPLADSVLGSLGLGDPGPEPARNELLTVRQVRPMAKNFKMELLDFLRHFHIGVADSPYE